MKLIIDCMGGDNSPDAQVEGAIVGIRRHADLNVVLVVFGRSSYQIAAGLTEQIEEYIDENYVSERAEEEYGGPIGTLSGERYRRRLLAESMTLDAEPEYAPQQKKASLEDVLNNLGESFQARLLRMIDERGMTDPEVYKRANVDRKLFSKIRCNENYIPKKKTIVALAIALRLNLDDTRDLLASAGLMLTNNSKSDVIVSFCIENGIYDIYEVNALLFQFQQPILG